MSSQRLTQSEATIALGELCQKIHREVGGPYLLELLIWQLIMSTIAHMNNEIMWTNENTAQQELHNGVFINSFVSTFIISKANQTDQRLLEVQLLEDSDYPVHIRDVHIIRALYQTQLPCQTQIPIGQSSSLPWTDPPFSTIVSHLAPDLHQLFFGYLQEEDIDFDVI